MPRCSNGHDSATADYCDVCGVPFSGSGTSGSGGTPAAAEAPPKSKTCGSCGQPMLSGARFCELCGWDAEAASLGGDPMPPLPDPFPDTISSVPVSSPPVVPPPPPPPDTGAGTWQVVAIADREYFDSVLAMEGEDASGLTFPAYWPERRFSVGGEQVVIGRHSRSRGTEPDIDLGGQFADPGVSHLHAMLVGQEGGGWAVVDLGSSNGTYVNDSPDPIEANVPVPIDDGDKIHLGAWTTLTIHAG